MIPMCYDQDDRAARAQGTCRAGPQATGYRSDVTEAQWRVILRTCRRVFRAGRAGLASGRRTARDYERLPASREAMILWAMITLMTCRLARAGQLSNTHLDNCRKTAAKRC